VLFLLKMPIFAPEVRRAASAAIKNFRNDINHFNVDMGFNEGFDCISDLLQSLRLTKAVQELQQYRSSVRALFPAYGKSGQFRQSREVPLLLIGRQYAPFRKHVLNEDGTLPTTCLLHFKSAASSGGRGNGLHLVNTGDLDIELVLAANIGSVAHEVGSARAGVATYESADAAGSGTEEPGGKRHGNGVINVGKVLRNGIGLAFDDDLGAASVN
jgi:hypothetical protein